MNNILKIKWFIKVLRPNETCVGSGYWDDRESNSVTVFFWWLFDFFFAVINLRFEGKKNT